MKYFPVIIFFFFTCQLFSQESISIGEIRDKYESFEYESAIHLADKLLAAQDSLLHNDLVNIYIMKAVSHYSIGDRLSSRQSFIELLNLDKNYQLDPVTISPKIITFFNEIKETYQPIEKDIPEEKITVMDTLKISDPMILKIQKEIIQGSAIRSILLPGWGHIYLEDNPKGWILTSASALTLGSMIYFIFDTNSKEQDYLNESREDLISKKYDDFNTSYRIRNTLIISYIVLWIYSQIDIFFFSDDRISQKINSELTFQHGSPQINLTYKIRF